MEMNRTRTLECQSGEGGSAHSVSRGDAGTAWCPQPCGMGSTTAIPVQLGGHGRNQCSPLSALPLLLLLLDLSLAACRSPSSLSSTHCKPN